MAKRGENMLLKIHLIISIIAFVMTAILNLGIAHKVRDKYGKEAYLKTYESNAFAAIFSWLKALLVCSLPLYNIIHLLVMLFCTEELERRTFKIVEDKMGHS